MRRPLMIILVLMGGGVALWSAGRGPSRACLDARAQRLANTAALCSSGSGGTSHGGWYGYRSISPSGWGSSIASIARGGFGAAGHAMASVGS
jgi:hypothetical protein